MSSFFVLKKYTVHSESPIVDYTAGSFIVFGLFMMIANVVFGIITILVGGCLFTLTRKARIEIGDFIIYDSILGFPLFTHKTIPIKDIKLIKIHQYSDIEGLARVQKVTSRIRIYQVSLYAGNRKSTTLNHKEYKDAIQTSKEINALAATELIDQIKERLIKNKQNYNKRLKNLKK